MLLLPGSKLSQRHPIPGKKTALPDYCSKALQHCFFNPKKIKNMILITGATGKIGGAVIRQLLTKMPASRLAALVRDAGKAADLAAAGLSIRTGNYDDTASLHAAMQGIEKVLLVSGGNAENGLQQHQNVVDAAKKAGVKCMAYTSRSLKDRHTLVNGMMVRHFETEDYIKESGLSYVLFRNSLYMDVLPMFVGAKVVDEGAFRLPAGGGKVSFALRSDMGEAIANVLSEDDCNNKTYNFTGGGPYSFEDVAAALAELSGREVKYAAVTPPEFAELMKGKKQPGFITRMITAFATDIEAGQESTVSADLADKLGRKPASLKEGLKTLFQL